MTFLPYRLRAFRWNPPIGRAPVVAKADEALMNRATHNSHSAGLYVVRPDADPAPSGVVKATIHRGGDFGNEVEHGLARPFATKAPLGGSHSIHQLEDQFLAADGRFDDEVIHAGNLDGVVHVILGLAFMFAVWLLVKWLRT